MSSGPPKPQVPMPEAILVDLPTAARMFGVGQTYFEKLLNNGTIDPIPIKWGKRRLLSIRLLRKWERMGMPKRAEWLRLTDDKKFTGCSRRGGAVGSAPDSVSGGQG